MHGRRDGSHAAAGVFAHASAVECKIARKLVTLVTTRAAGTLSKNVQVPRCMTAILPRSSDLLVRAVSANRGKVQTASVLVITAEDAPNRAMVNGTRQPSISSVSNGTTSSAKLCARAATPCRYTVSAAIDYMKWPQAKMQLCFYRIFGKQWGVSTVVGATAL